MEGRKQEVQNHHADKDHQEHDDPVDRMADKFPINHQEPPLFLAFPIAASTVRTTRNPPAAIRKTVTQFVGVHEMIVVPIKDTSQAK